MLQNLVALPADSPLWPYQLALRYTVIDIGAFGTAELETRKGLIPLWFQLETPGIRTSYCERCRLSRHGSTTMLVIRGSSRSWRTW